MWRLAAFKQWVLGPHDGKLPNQPSSPNCVGHHPGEQELLQAQRPASWGCACKASNEEPCTASGRDGCAWMKQQPPPEHCSIGMMPWNVGSSPLQGKRLNYHEVIARLWPRKLNLPHNLGLLAHQQTPYA
jgi:hypothetical protein